MAKTGELDLELATGLKAAKSKKMHFAVIAKGSSDGALIVSKQKIPPKEIAAAKKASGGTAVFKGKVEVIDGRYQFQVNKEPPQTLAACIKKIAKSDAGLTLNVECVKSTDPDDLLDEDGGRAGDLPEGLGEAMQEMFDEDAAPYKAARERVEPKLAQAARMQPAVQRSFDAMEELAGQRKFAEAERAAVNLNAEIDRLFADQKKIWAKRLGEFRATLQMADRMNVSRATQIGTLEEEISNAESSNRPQTAAAAKQQLAALRGSVNPGEQIRELYNQAEVLAEKCDFAAAGAKLDEGARLGQAAKTELDSKIREIKKATESAKAAELKAFDFAARMKDPSWGFDTDDDAMTFLVGSAPDAKGNIVKSERLKQMEAVVAAAIVRKDALIASGATPEEAGLAAFANIPENFWPDSVVKEVLMFRRAQAAFEEEERAKQVNKELTETLDGMLEKNETIGSVVGKVSDQLDTPDKIEKVNKALGLVGQKIKDPKAAAELGNTFKDFMQGYNYVAGGAAVLSKGAVAIQKGIEASRETESPVAKKLAEFQRNKAIIEAVNKMVDMGLGMTEICPALKIASGGKDMVLEVTKAVQYFIKLAQIAGLKENAKLDPETMMELPLARMARNQKIRASQATINAAAKLLETAGAITEVAGGPAAAAGLALDVTGKVITYGSKVVFKGISIADAKRACATMKKASGPPPNRKAMTEIFKNSNKFAVYALAYGCTEGNDPWAIAYVVKQGLTEDDLKSPATSVKIVREYLLQTAGGLLGEGDEEEKFNKQPGALDKVGQTLKKGAEKVRDTVIGRDTSKPLDATWRAAKAELTRANWQQTKPAAIAAGWYDDRSGLGDVLSAMESASAEFAFARQDAKKAEAFYLSVRTLTSTLNSIRPLANDQQTPHPGMTAYIDELSKKSVKLQDEVSKLWNQILDKQLGGSPEEVAKKKAALLEAAAQEYQEKQTANAAARRKAIADLWRTRKVETPYGKLTLPDFVMAAVKQLGLDPATANQLGGAVIELGEDCVNVLQADLAGVPEGEFPKEFELQANKLAGSLVGPLRTIANAHFENLQSQRGTGDENDNWQPSNFTLSKKAWEATKSDAEKHGWVRTKTNIAETIEAYEKAWANWQANRTNEKNIRLVLIAFQQLDKVFSAFQPLKKNKLPHQGMARYRTTLLSSIARSREAFEKIRSELPPPESNSGWKPTDFSLKESVWEGQKKAAIQAGLVDKSTGIGKAFKVLEAAEAKHQTDPNAKNKAILVKALANLRATMTKFDPRDKSMVPFPGMLTYKTTILAAIAEYEKSLA